MVAPLALLPLVGGLGTQGFFKAIDEIKSIREADNANEQVEKLKRALFYIESFIHETNERSVVDETKKIQVKDVIKLRDEIEDALEIFDLGREKIKVPFFSNLPKRSLKKLQEKVSQISSYADLFNADQMGERKKHNTQSKPPDIKETDYKKEPEVVGFDEDIRTVVNALCDEDTSLAVVSIVGPVGIGKTTLALKVCHRKEVKDKFRKIAWVDIPETFVLLDGLKKIAKCFSIESTDDDSDPDTLTAKISNHLLLADKRYLIVFDNVWKKDLWDEIIKEKMVFHNGQGSRVLITSRMVVDFHTSEGTCKCEQYKPKLLSSTESLKLFLTHATTPQKQSFPKLEEVAEKFIKKCEGLPLALVGLGHHLKSTEAFEYHNWNKFLSTMSWHEIKKCNDAIDTSYEQLPTLAEKLCFLYFAAIPKDKKIEAQPLLRMWIAEGFIPHDERKTLEQTAENYLKDLVQRSMVNVSEKYSDGSMKYLHVFDIVRDFVIKKAKDMEFLSVCSKEGHWMLPHFKDARRVAVHHSNFNESMKKNANPKLRSLIIFGKSKLDCSKHELLRVLASLDEEVELESFERLPLLRYQQNTMVRKFKKMIKTMKSLQTLDLRLASHGAVTSRIWEIETLRHVHLSPKSTKGPPASAKLANLQTLRGVRNRKSWNTSKLPDISEVCELDIHLDNPYEMEVFTALLYKMKNLVYLSISGSDIQMQKFEGKFQNFNNLKSAIINNENGGSILELRGNMLAPNLIELHLKGFEFMSDPMPVLENFPFLKILTISSSNGSHPLQLSCSTTGFKMLEELTLDSIENLNNWEIETGSMPVLKCLKIVKCDRLPLLHQEWFIDHKSLQDLHWPNADNAYLEKITKILRARKILGNSPKPFPVDEYTEVGDLQNTPIPWSHTFVRSCDEARHKDGASTSRSAPHHQANSYVDSDYSDNHESEEE